MRANRSPPKLAQRHLRLPADTEELRALRHDLRTPINPLLGYCELIVEEAGDAAPGPFLAGMRKLHATGAQMLKLTNEIFSDQPSGLRQLDCAELQCEFRGPAEAAATLCRQLEQQAVVAALPVAARDLQRIGVAVDRWLKRIEEMLEENCR
ncbi:MAG: histidine kinase dimerization/phospho-acceptor domain-containing protein [Limisphaerales bacterium]